MASPWEQAQARWEELFRHLPGVRGGYVTDSHYNIAQLNVVEAVVLSAVEVLTGPDEPLTVSGRGPR